MVVEEEAGPEVFGRAVQHLAAYFYPDDGPLTSTQALIIQQEFDVLTELLDRVVLRKIFRNTVGIVWHDCRDTGGHSAEAYGRLMAG